MDRAYIAQMRQDIQDKRASLHRQLAELDVQEADLDAAERVMDRKDGKAISKTPTALGDILGAKLRRNLIAHDNSRAYTTWKNTILQAPSKFAGGSDEWISKLLAYECDASMAIPDGSTDFTRLALADLYSVELPEKKPTMPDMILKVLTLLQLNYPEMLPIRPKQVEHLLKQLYDIDSGNQNVNSVMWRMADRGELEKSPDAPLYSLPKTKVTAHEHDPNEL